MIQMTWQEYVNWLIKTQNMTVYKALDKAGEVYERQHKKVFATTKTKEVEEFWNKFWECDNEVLKGD